MTAAKGQDGSGEKKKNCFSMFQPPNNSGNLSPFPPRFIAFKRLLFQEL